jgi:predicted RNA-binding protein with PIN domain
MVWDSLPKSEIEKIKKQIDESAEKMLQDKEYKEFFNLTEEEVQAQLEKIRQSKE